MRTVYCNVYFIPKYQFCIPIIMISDVLSNDYSLWILFGLLVGIALAVDLGLFNSLKKRFLPSLHLHKSATSTQDNLHREGTATIRSGTSKYGGNTFRQALGWTMVWISLAAIFAIVILYQQGYDKMLEFVTGYAIEKSLSVDNMFVFLLIFSSLGISHVYQHRVLSAGIISAIAMRVPLIMVGVALLESFHWMMYVFGGMLILTAARMLLQRKEKEIKLEKNIAVRILKKIVPVTLEPQNGKFLSRINGVLYATPMLAALVIVEMTDLVFAIDSIPAVLAITTDPFIVITSNIFAILGLRSLYFLLAGAMERFHYIKPALVALLLFIGIKMIVADVFKISVLASLAIIGSILGSALILSIIRTRRLNKNTVVEG